MNTTNSPKAPTAKTLCHSIHSIIWALYGEERDQIIRTYEKTWTLVNLTEEGLATPTKDAYHRLLNLWGVVQKAYDEQRKNTKVIK